MLQLFVCPYNVLLTIYLNCMFLKDANLTFDETYFVHFRSISNGSNNTQTDNFTMQFL